MSFVSIQEGRDRCYYFYIQIGQDLNIYEAGEFIYAFNNYQGEAPFPRPLEYVQFQPGSFVRELTFISESEALLIEQPDGVSYSSDPIPPLRLITI